MYVQYASHGRVFHGKSRSDSCTAQEIENRRPPWFTHGTQNPSLTCRTGHILLYTVGARVSRQDYRTSLVWCKDDRLWLQLCISLHLILIKTDAHGLPSKRPRLYLIWRVLRRGTQLQGQALLVRNPILAKHVALQSRRYMLNISETMHKEVSAGS